MVAVPRRKSDGQGKLLGFKTVIRPSSNSVRRHYNKISETIGRLKAAPQEKIISELNPIIRGWCNYYKTVCSQETYSKVDYLTHLRLRRWADRRHPNKGKYWVGDKYWITIGGDRWVFGKEYKGDKITLARHTQTAISRHVKVQGNKTPYDGDTIYWAKRKGSHPELKPSTAKLLKKQKGKCKNKESRVKSQESRELEPSTESQESRVKGVESKVESQESRFLNREQAELKGTNVRLPIELIDWVDDLVKQGSRDKNKSRIPKEVWFQAALELFQAMPVDWDDISDEDELKDKLKSLESRLKSL